VTGQIGLATVNDGGLRGIKSGLGERVVDAGFRQGGDAHVMANRGVTGVALAAFGMLGMREARRRQLDVRVASLAALAGNRGDLLQRELGVAGDVSGDLFEGSDLVLHPRDLASVNVTLDACDVLVRTLRPCRVERAHLVACRSAEAWLVSGLRDSGEGDARYDGCDRDCGDEPNGDLAAGRAWGRTLSIHAPIFGTDTLEFHESGVRILTGLHAAFDRMQASNGE
jgi:hypothetical protein